MDDSVNHNNNENSIQLETENSQEAQNINSSSESYHLKNLKGLNREKNKSRHRRAARQNIKNHRYSDEDCNSTLSQNSSENNRNSTEDIPLREPSSSNYLFKDIASVKNSMHKKKRNNLIDTLGQVLVEIGLYDELYEFMKSRGITAEALKYMQTRHIDELFKGTRLSTKIIFEHKLKEWQNKNCKVTTSEINNGHINNTHQGVQLLPHLNTSSLNQRLNETEITLLSNHLTSAVQEAINKALQELKTPSQQYQQQLNNYNMQIHDEIPIDEDTLKNIKTEPNFYSEEPFASDDKSYQKIDRNQNKLRNTSNDVLNLQQSPESIMPKLKRRKINNDISIHEILCSYQFGQHLLDEYQKNGVFTSSQRNDLVRIIVEYYARNNQIVNISLCKHIAEEIVELFPTETMDVYFNQENKSKPPKGKIWDRYQARKRSIRKINGLNATGKEINKRDKPNGDIRDTVDWSDMEAMCAEMKYIRDEKLLLEKWKDSFAFRRHQLQTGWFSNWKLYFDEYPFCKQQNYAKFIESDLDTLYPNLKFNDYLWDEFMKNISTFLSNRIKHPQSKEIFEQLIADNNLESCSDYVAIKVIELLHAVLKTYGKQLQSVEDAQRQFTVQVMDLSDLKKAVIERKKLCTDSNIQAKPYIAVVGQNKTYSHFSVILDSTGFSCDNYKDSLILCFNLYLFFELSFPYESLNVWTFIQQYFFNKPTLVNNPRVESFINDVKAQKLSLFDNDIKGTQ